MGDGNLNYAAARASIESTSSLDVNPGECAGSVDDAGEPELQSPVMVYSPGIFSQSETKPAQSESTLWCSCVGRSPARPIKRPGALRVNTLEKVDNLGLLLHGLGDRV